MSGLPLGLNGAESAPSAELSRARYELDKVVTKSKQHAGLPFELSEGDQRSFREVQQIAERYPDDVKVQELVAKAKEIYRSAKGERFQFTPEMLAYRQRGAKLAEVVAAAGKARWEVLQKELGDDGLLVEKIFPTADPLEEGPDGLSGRRVVLADVPYEQDLFVSAGVNWVGVGSAAQGHYWVNGSGPRFNQLFEALGRYRGLVQQNLPPKWTFVGSVDGPELLAPGGSAADIKEAYMGWAVSPEVIYIPGVVLVEWRADAKAGAVFAGEEDMAKRITYSVNSVPDDVEPKQLLEIYITALKEKNFDLHLECIDPELRKVEPQIHGLRYNWEVQQKGIEQIHVHAEPFEIGEVKVIKGGTDDGLESFFGDAEKPLKTAFSKEEEVVVNVRLFDKDGVQSVRPRVVKLIRREGGRWYIRSGATLTF